MQLTCPCCHARYPLDAAVQDEEARELLAMSASSADLWPLLVTYLTLFRPAKTSLSWSRAKRIAKQALELTADTRALAEALHQTIDTMGEKRSLGGWKPLSNHNYLKRCLETAEARLHSASVVSPAPVKQAVSKGAQAMVALQGMKR